MSEKVINQKIIDITKCDKDFLCLNEATRHKICKVERCLESKICFLKNGTNKPCINKVNYANSLICNCPVRVELFEKYNI